MSYGEIEKSGTVDHIWEQNNHTILSEILFTNPSYDEMWIGCKRRNSIKNAA